MQIAPALRYAFRFVSLSAVVFTIAFAVPPLFGEDIDPRDYIGEDISKYPPQLRQQIERAFLRETGERFTGSQYDPCSPDYAFAGKKRRTSISDVDLIQGGYTPWERMGQNAISQVDGGVPPYIKNQIEEYRIQKREREVSLKIKEAELESYNKESKKTGIDSSASSNLSTLDLNGLQNIANKGNIDAAHELANRYKLGNGTSVDFKQAEYWFHQAALQGHAESAYCLGCLYFDGNGVEVNKKLHKYWLEKAADKGHLMAKSDLDFFY